MVPWTSSSVPTVGDHQQTRQPARGDSKANFVAHGGSVGELVLAIMGDEMMGFHPGVGHYMLYYVWKSHRFQMSEERV